MMRMTRPGRLCPLCNGKQQVCFLRRGRTPVCQNVLWATRAEARAQPAGRMEMALCGECGMVWNRTYDPALVPYGPGYVNAQTASPAFIRYQTGLVRRLTAVTRGKPARVLEIGCGDGLLMKELVAASPLIRGFGLDPAYRGPARLAGGRLRLERRAFSPGGPLPPADMVICRQVIEHIADPVAFLRALRQALGGRRRPRVFFETSCLRWILRRRAVWDFFYEHCVLFSAATLKRAFAEAGFRPVRTWHDFGGAYLWIEAELPAAPAHPRTDVAIPLLVDRYQEGEKQLFARWRKVLRQGGGHTALWGAAAKGLTFASLFDPDHRFLDCLVDANPAKQGRYLPLSGHEVIAPSALSRRGITQVVVTNPQYLGEIRAAVRRLGLKCPVIGPHS